MKHTFRLIFVSLALALLLFPQSLSAQLETYRFMGMQISYPSNCMIFSVEKDDDLATGPGCSFIVSAIYPDGTEGRMSVSVQKITTCASALAALGIDTGKMNKSTLLGLNVLLDAFSPFSSPMYSHPKLKEEDVKGDMVTNCYLDFSGRYYPYKRTSDTLVYESFKGRSYSRIIGDYIASFVMQIPYGHKFKTLQDIANSLTFSRYTDSF